MDSILFNAQEAVMSSLNIIIKRITFPEFDASQNARRKSYTFLFTIPLRAIWFVRHMFGMTCAIGTTTSVQKHFTFDALLPLRYYVPSIDKSQWRSILVLASIRDICEVPRMSVIHPCWAGRITVCIDEIPIQFYVWTPAQTHSFSFNVSG